MMVSARLLDRHISLHYCMKMMHIWFLFLDVVLKVCCVCLCVWVCLCMCVGGFGPDCLLGVPSHHCCKASVHRVLVQPKRKRDV